MPTMKYGVATLTIIKIFKRNFLKVTISRMKLLLKK